MRSWILLSVVGLLTVVSPAHADLSLCFQRLKPLGQQFSWQDGVTKAQVTDRECVVIDAQSPNYAPQLALVQSTIRDKPAKHYLKLGRDGLAIAMHPIEMDRVDQYAKVQETLQDEFKRELELWLCKVDEIVHVETALLGRRQALNQRLKETPPEKIEEVQNAEIFLWLEHAFRCFNALRKVVGQ